MTFTTPRAAAFAAALSLLLLRDSTNAMPDLHDTQATTPAPPAGLVDVVSRHSVEETVTRLKSLLDARGLTLFALIDHSREAAKAGMTMRPATLLIFGSPKAGTPLMIAAPSVAIDLPLKILVWEDAGSVVRVTYNSPSYLGERHHLPADLVQNIAGIQVLAAKAAE